MWSVGGVGPFCQIPGVALYAGEPIVKNFAALQRYMIHGGMLRRGHNNCLFIGGGGCKYGNAFDQPKLGSEKRIYMVNIYKLAERAIN